MYLTIDHLGSTRVVTDVTGTPVSRHDYLPFGEEIESGIGERSTVPGYDVTSTQTHTIKFTGQERDVETGRDHFPARYYASMLGRWLTRDPAGTFAVTPANPQTWNMLGVAGFNSS